MLPIRRYELSAEEAAEAFALADRCVREYDSVEGPDFLEQAAVVAAELPKPLQRFMNRARLDDRKHAVLIAGNEARHARLEDTPEHWKLADTDGSRAHGFLLALYSCLLGDLIGWTSQQDGRLVTDVLPVRGLEQSLVSSSSHRELGWHTEDAFSPYRADYVGLLCLRTRGDTATTVSYVDVGSLPPDVHHVLRQPRFRIVPDPSHALSADAGQDRVPLLHGHPDAPTLCIDRDFTSGVEGDDEAERALAHLVAHLDENLYEVPLAAGDVCFIDNRNVVHGRRPFRPRYDGKDRWLKRVNLVADLRRVRPGRRTATSRAIG
ncbi:TauD/TfdA family dioxygenase [Saccharothrix sp. HUAS TT1]|uniref:TauD/TfdA family dioxygenase n=1 Tax=unclassified Saccharothrix TaxID=2593673 RepID=UPI00345C0C78